MVDVNREEFVYMISLLASFVDKDHHAEVLRNICFRAGMALAFDKQVGYAQKFDMGDEFCVNAKQFSSIVKSMPGEQIRLTMKGSSLVVSSRGNKATIPTATTKGYPFFLPTTQDIYYDGPGLKEAVGRALFCAESRGPKTSLKGVGMRDEYCYGVDPSARLCRTKMPSKVAYPMVITPTGARAMVNFDAADKVLTDGKSLHLAWANPLRVAVMATYDCSGYPFNATDTILERALESKYNVSLPKELPAAIKRVTTPAGSKQSTAIIMTVANNEMLLTLDPVDGIDCEELLPFECQHNFSIKISSSYLMDAAEQFENMNVKDVVAGERAFLRFFSKDTEHVLSLRV